MSNFPSIKNRIKIVVHFFCTQKHLQKEAHEPTLYHLRELLWTDIYCSEQIIEIAMNNDNI